MTDRFNECLDFVLKWEGGYSNHPADRGGATNYGVTQQVLSMWEKLHPEAPDDVADLTHDQAAAIYRSLYWDKAGCGTLPAPLDLAVFDSAVNCGITRAVKWLQEVIGVKSDGMMGPLTHNVVQLEVERVGVADVVRRFLDKRHDHYQEIVENNASQSVFLRGWMNRLEDLDNECCKPA